MRYFKICGLVHHLTTLTTEYWILAIYSWMFLKSFIFYSIHNIIC